MRLLFIAFMILLASTALAKHKHPERHYQDNFCDKANGIKEFILPDRARVDCLTEDMAIEVDFAPKWAESIGQALYYASMTGKKPAVLLILEDEQDNIYVQRFNTANHERNLGITLFILEDYGEEQ